MLDEENDQTGTKESGRFGYTPIPSDHDEHSSVASMTPSFDPFGLVLLLGSIQPVWELKSLFCYRGYWLDDRTPPILSSEPSAARQEVVLTLATGFSNTIAL